MELKKDWQHFLIEIGKTGAEVARDLKQAPQNINRKITTGTIKATELDEILNHFGYTLTITKKEG